MLPPSPCSTSRGQHRARAREHVREVDAVEVVPLVVGLLVERGAPAAEVADVVDEDVDAAEVVARRGDERLGRAGLAHVADDADARARPTATCVVAGPVGVDLGEHDRRAFGGEPLDDAAADPAAAAGDDRDLALEHGAAA